MIFANPYYNEAEKVDLLCRWILVHCLLYYVLDKSIVEDKVYDRNAKQLEEMLKTAKPNEKHRRIFKGFTASTGFDLPNRLKKDRQYYNYLIMQANQVLKTQEYIKLKGDKENER